MLYKLNSTNSKFDKIEPVAFKDFSSFGRLEKDLEELIAQNILGVLFEDASLMPIFRERQRQAEADIYALNGKGELTIFELKRGAAGEEAVHQVLRYAQNASQWSFTQLEAKYQQYSGSQSGLLRAHQDAFNLEHPLDIKEINNQQHLFIIGSAVDENLVNSVEYWYEEGISIRFLPYRIYELGGERYFEFFALPYDKHKNPAYSKGVLFDTNRSYNEESIWYMIENSRVAAFGDAKRFVEYVYSGDIVFFSQDGRALLRRLGSRIARFRLPIPQHCIEMSSSSPRSPKEAKSSRPCRLKQCLKLRVKTSFGRVRSRFHICRWQKRTT